MTVVTYLDGSQLTTNELTKDQIQAIFQEATAKMLGLIWDPLSVLLSINNGSSIAGISSTTQIYPNLLVTGPGIPVGTTINSFTSSTLNLTNNATATGLSESTITDPNVYSKVRIGWQEEGQPGPPRDSDTVTIRCMPTSTEFSRLHDSVFLSTNNPTEVSQQDVYTRTWKTDWSFTGPNSEINARLVVSGLLKVPLIDSLLAQNNLFINPDISEPLRIPELFQGEWWERVDLSAECNEQITEILTVGTVRSVEVLVYTKDGKLSDTTVIGS